MNKKSVAIIATIAILVGGALVYAFYFMPKAEVQNVVDDSDSTQDVAKTDTNSKDSTPKPSSSTSEPGKYVTYSESEFNSTSGTRLLFFHASWCPQCRALEASINESTIPSGVTIFEVDYDSNQALRAKYGVTIQTTVVRVDESGEKAELYVAYNEPTFANVKAELLD